MNLYCSLQNRLLRRILDKKVHWNNLETNAHIHFKRVPNKNGSRCSHNNEFSFIVNQFFIV